MYIVGTVKQDHYLYMLQPECWLWVKNQNDIYFQRDGAPPYNGLRIQE